MNYNNISHLHNFQLSQDTYNAFYSLTNAMISIYLIIDHLFITNSYLIYNLYLFSIQNRGTPTVAYLCSIAYILLQTLISFSIPLLQNHSYEYVLSIVLNIFSQWDLALAYVALSTP